MYFIANLKFLKGRANSNGITFHKLTFALNLLSTRFAHIILEIKGTTNAIKEKGNITNLAERTEYITEKITNMKQR